jgi:tight adherence protein B
MGSTTIIIFITLAVAAAAYAITQILSEMADPERRRLKQRLTSDGKQASSDQPAISLYLAQQPKNPLHRIKLLAGLQASLRQAYPNASFARFLLLCVGLAFVGYIVLWALTGAEVLGVLVGGALGIAPALFLSMKRAARQKTMANQLPEALDFLGRVLRAGHSLSTGLQMVGTELPEPLAGEFRAAYDQHSVGVSMDTALRDMTKRVESTDFAFFVTATLIQRQTGGDLVQVLGNISHMVRQRLRLQQQVKAKTAEGRFTGYILSAFPAVMFGVSYVLNPTYASQLLHSGTGMILAAIALGLELLGLISIKMLTTVRV